MTLVIWLRIYVIALFLSFVASLDKKVLIYVHHCRVGKELYIRKSRMWTMT